MTREEYKVVEIGKKGDRTRAQKEITEKLFHCSISPQTYVCVCATGSGRVSTHTAGERAREHESEGESDDFCQASATTLTSNSKCLSNNIGMQSHEEEEVI